MELEGKGKVFYSLLEIAASLFSSGTSFQDLPNHSYPGEGGG